MDASVTLDSLGITFGTDKSSAGHGYLSFYERYLAPLRDRPIKLLEIGVFGGASLSVWHSYFSRATIVGADIDRATKRFAQDRVAIEIIDQSNIEHLTRLALKHGPFDIVVEDGSHMWEHQITGLKTLFPFLKNGGFYIVEDLHTNFGPVAARYRGQAQESCVEYLKKLVDCRVADEQLDPASEADAFLRSYGRAMSSIVFSRHACLIEKMYHEDVVASAHEPLLAPECAGSSLPISLLGHFGHQGDKLGRSGWVRASRARQGMQGFSIKVAGQHCPIQYRARSASGIWSDWVSDGQYVGTRGRAENLTGFSLRLDQKARNSFTLRAAGTFSDTETVTLVNDGEDCVSESGRHALAGMQVVLRAAK